MAKKTNVKAEETVLKEEVKTEVKPETKKATTKKTTSNKTGSNSKKSVAKQQAEKKEVEVKPVEQQVATQKPKQTTKKSSAKSTTNKKYSQPKPVEVKIDEITEENNLINNNEKGKTKKVEEEIRKPRILTPEEVNPKLKKEQEKKERKRKKNKNLDLDSVERFIVNPKKGLTDEQVQQRVADGLTNKVENKNVKTYRSIFFTNIFTFFNLLCFAVAAALIAVQAWSNLFFLLIITCNIVIGIVQEIRAKKTIEKISLVSAPTANVLRDGHQREISVDDVVLDDVIYFSTGKQICADCKLLEGEVEANESLLTGESVAVKKRKGDILYSGSFIASGKCMALVERVGEFNYTAKLSAKAKEYKKPKSELLRSLNFIIRCIGVIIIPLAILMYYNNVAELNSITETVKKTAGSIIGMIPSGMFLLTSMALAVGVIKLSRKHTLVQDLYSIEMLARTDVLCLDKTGTITDGSMKVNTVIQIKDCSHTVNDIMGSMLTALEDNNQTSRALANHFGYSKEFTKSAIVPFSSARKLSAVTFKNGETYAFGAPEFVIREKNAEVDKLVKQYATKGFRVILLAKCDGKIENDKVPAKRSPVAIIVIEDHIREDAAETLNWFKQNQVQVKIISGDNPITVSEVSKRVGVENAERFISLEGLNEQQVIDAADKYTVFGRVSPEQKMILVKALKNQGHKVAMTGDGVNDILALKEADCSIAMASGSEATRNVSHLVLMDSNFASMPSVVAEGRRVINNIQKSSSLFLMKTLFTMILSVFCLIMSTEYPFNTSQVMLLESCVIGIPAFFLSLQPNKEPIQGKFLSNLITNALPGAIILSLTVISCFVFDLLVGTSGQLETMGSLVVTLAGFLVLFKVCKPFDVFRSCLFFAMLVVTVLVLTFVPWTFFDYVKLNLQNVLFMLCIVQFSYPLYANIVNLCNKIRFSSLDK